jgi:hypothetical protein
MSNQFSDTYKKLPTSKLLEIIENKKDYQPVAIEAALLELESRQDLDEAKNELNEKNITKQKKEEATSQKKKELTDKAFKALGYVDPLTEKKTEKSVVILCVLLLLIFLYKTVTTFDTLLSVFKSFGHNDIIIYILLIEYLYLPVTIFFLWRRSMVGWSMLLIWLIIQTLLDCSGLYMCYQLSGIGDSFSQFMPMPSLYSYLMGLAFHGTLLYFICKPNIRSLFRRKDENEALDADL